MHNPVAFAQRNSPSRQLQTTSEVTRQELRVYTHLKSTLSLMFEKDAAAQ
jgi:hypothetical protein